MVSWILLVSLQQQVTGCVFKDAPAPELVWRAVCRSAADGNPGKGRGRAACLEGHHP